MSEQMVSDERTLCGALRRKGKGKKLTVRSLSALTRQVSRAVLPSATVTLGELDTSM